MECRVSGFANNQSSLALRVVMARASEADVEHIVIVIAIAFAFANKIHRKNGSVCIFAPRSLKLLYLKPKMPS